MTMLKHACVPTCLHQNLKLVRFRVDFSSCHASYRWSQLRSETERDCRWILMVVEQSNKLKAAVSDLVKAACLDVRTEFGSEVAHNIHICNTSLKGLEQRVEDLTSKTDSQIERLTREVEDLKKGVNSINQKLEDEAKMQALSWALQFIKTDTHGEAFQDKRLVRDILYAFRRGEAGIVLVDKWKMYLTSKDFRDGLQTYLHGLIGVKPRLVLDESESSLTVYYS